MTNRLVGRTGRPRNVAINVVHIGKVTKANARWSADLRSMLLLNGVPTEPIANLVFVLCQGCASTA